MTATLITYPHQILRTKCKRVAPLDPSLPNTIKEMIAIMRQYNGIGLAAPQIGLGIQVAIIYIPAALQEDRPSLYWVSGREESAVDRFFTLLNPRLELSKTKVMGEEGCLSLPKTNGIITRARYATVTTDTLDGGHITYRTGGLLARAIQHEYDHLHGILYTDRMEDTDRRSCLAKLG